MPKESVARSDCSQVMPRPRLRDESRDDEEALTYCKVVFVSRRLFTIFSGRELASFRSGWLTFDPAAFSYN
jgi:hypothetical protein